MQITLTKWICLLIMLILRPGFSAFCAAYLMSYADGQWYNFIAGAIALNACFEARDIYREIRDAR
ncbi:hypothetical protein [Enterobacter ludwigii]|uniref:hypothetical protein n=1 Tax=Enterobacter ludwigii TaxID=299767 RepID=UPI0013D22139|nr:hypothetical protein [Enterobacter ludwigii]